MKECDVVATSKAAFFSRILPSTTFLSVCIITGLTCYIQFAKKTPPRAWSLLGYNYLVPKLFGGHLPSSAEVWGFLYIGIVIYLWRVLTVQSCWARKLQDRGYKVGRKWIIFFQWHSIFHGLLLWEMNLCLRNICEFDWSGRPDLLWKLSSSHDPPPMCVWKLTSYAPFACIGTFAVITKHLFRLRFLARRRYLSSNLLDFEKFRTTDYAIVCILLPSWFSITALFCQIRMWQVVGGDMAPGATPMDYLSLFHSNLAIAVLVELIAIYAFAKLTMRHIEKAEKYQKIFGKPAIYWLTMNGVGLCVFTGALQSIFRFVSLVFLQQIDRAVVISGQLCGKEQLQNDVPMLVYCTLPRYSHQLDLISTAGVLLCAYNMFFVCSLDEVEKVLPRANLKFTATRMLIIVAQIQSKFLLPNSITVADYEAPYHFNLDGYTCALIHVSLMQYEVFVIALVQFFIWNDPLQQDTVELKERALMLGYTNVDNALDKALLEDDDFALEESVNEDEEAVTAMSMMSRLYGNSETSVNSETSEGLRRIDNRLTRIEAMDGQSSAR